MKYFIPVDSLFFSNFLLFFCFSPTPLSSSGFFSSPDYGGSDGEGKMQFILR